MIKTIIVISNDPTKYLYENEKNVLLNMLNSNLNVLHFNKKRFNVLKTANNTAKVTISNITTKIFFFNEYKLLTTLKIKYN